MVVAVELEHFQNFVAADVSRRKLNRDGISWRELTFAATDLLKRPQPQADEFRVPGGLSRRSQTKADG